MEGFIALLKIIKLANGRADLNPRTVLEPIFLTILLHCLSAWLYKGLVKQRVLGQFQGLHLFWDGESVCGIHVVTCEVARRFSQP